MSNTPLISSAGDVAHHKERLMKRFLKRHGIKSRGSVDLEFNAVTSFIDRMLGGEDGLEESLKAQINAYFYGQEEKVPSHADARVEAIVDEAVIVSRFYDIVEQVKGFINAGDFSQIYDLRNEIISMIKASMPPGTDWAKNLADDTDDKALKITREYVLRFEVQRLLQTIGAESKLSKPQERLLESFVDRLREIIAFFSLPITLKSGKDRRESKVEESAISAVLQIFKALPKKVGGFAR